MSASTLRQNGNKHAPARPRRGAHIVVPISQDSGPRHSVYGASRRAPENLEKDMDFADRERMRREEGPIKKRTVRPSAATEETGRRGGGGRPAGTGSRGARCLGLRRRAALASADLSPRLKQMWRGGGKGRGVGVFWGWPCGRGGKSGGAQLPSKTKNPGRFALHTAATRLRLHFTNHNKGQKGKQKRLLICSKIGAQNLAG